ncbi:aldose epimerase family protein [Janthinobacterium sp. PAMC25594]|uniref:aldose epimerase family protein n=1 Tax=Janthinobacterium sp. PAMC25594 TaxID=2861284 RepID=UPI001C63A1BC|nr:aldose epimerase family protein [Janthinobacterium sp. PAMC25594]QYG05068.1 galactose mutarotase [Janthinobacterium sp. PAMC25594]
MTPVDSVSVTQAPFGILPDGQHVTVFTLANRQGMQVKVLDFGAIISAIHVPDRDGAFADVVLGFDRLEPYLQNSAFLGAVIGRFGNRIAAGRFSLDGKDYQLAVNNAPNHLHGGNQGFHQVMWQAAPFTTDDAVGVTFTRCSPDGEDGYPGKLDVTLTYELDDDNALSLRYHAVTDQATPINLTNHSYFNLAGQGSILGHELTINADRYLPVDAGAIPTGELADVTGTPFDLRQSAVIGDSITLPHEQLRIGRGYDHNFVLNQQPGQALTLAAMVREPESGRVMQVYTQEPGIQFYSGNFLDGSQHGKRGAHSYRSALCLETQHFPDSPNQAHFPNAILRLGEEYRTVTVYRFSAE